jgi:hypothetical protein
LPRSATGMFDAKPSIKGGPTLEKQPIPGRETMIRDVPVDPLQGLPGCFRRSP